MTAMFIGRGLAIDVRIDADDLHAARHVTSGIIVDIGRCDGSFFM